LKKEDMSNNNHELPGKADFKSCPHEGAAFGRNLTQFEYDYLALCRQLSSIGAKPPVIDVARGPAESYNNTTVDNHE
jgi:hypothetical protein